MLVTGLSLNRFREITDQVSVERYEGNVIVHQDAHPLSGNRFRGRLWVQSSRGSGARRSWSGRRMPAACWHAYRDVLMALFNEYPDARVRTGLANYRGLDGFMRDYPGTAYTNVGSAMAPAYMPDLCECNGNEPAAFSEYTRQYREPILVPSMHYLSPDSMTPDTSQPYLLDAIDDVISAAERLRELSV